VRKSTKGKRAKRNAYDSCAAFPRQSSAHALERTRFTKAVTGTPPRKRCLWGPRLQVAMVRPQPFCFSQVTLIADPHASAGGLAAYAAPAAVRTTRARPVLTPAECSEGAVANEPYKPRPKQCAPAPSPGCSRGCLLLRPRAASHCRRHPAAWRSLTFSAVCPLELRFAQDSNICRKNVTDGGGPLRYSFLVNT